MAILNVCGNQFVVKDATLIVENHQKYKTSLILCFTNILPSCTGAKTFIRIDAMLFV